MTFDPDATRPLDPDATGPNLDTDGDVPPVIGGYRLLRVLGAGGMGKVFEAEEIATGRRVAVKLIAARNVTSADAVARFRREGQLAATITHPRCVFVLRADEEAGQPYLVMELMPGTTLKDLIAAKGPLAPGEAVAKMCDVLDGLGALHQIGIIHRDVKPANCFLDANGRVKVGDFGLARALLGGGGDSLTGSGVFLGTPLFASPEQLKGKPVDVRTDVYSAATTLYYLLTGRAPFEGGDAAGVVARIASEDPPPLRAFRPDLPPALERAVLRGLARDPEKRYKNLDDFRAALYPFLPGNRLTFGGMGLRFFANLADGAILFAVCSLAILGVLLVHGTIPFWLGTLTSCIFICAYFILLEGLLGWTPGKWLLGLRVYGAHTERPPGMGTAAARIVALVAVLNLLNGDLVALLPLPQGFKDICARRYIVFSVPVDQDEGAPEGMPPSRSAREVLPFEKVDDPTGPSDPLPEQLPDARKQGNGGQQPRDSGPRQLQAGFFLVATHVGVLLLLCTMRQCNGYRGLHEFLSGTRVVHVPVPPRTKPVRLNPSGPEQPLAEEPAPDLPRRRGPYEVQGVLPGTDGTDLLLGEDVALGRQVLLVRRPRAQEGMSAARQAVSRMTRPRWLSSGTAAGERFEAFVAPDRGWSLPHLLQLCPPLPWRETRLLLEQLADELTAALADGTLPACLTVEQIWVQPDGKLLLLDWPVHAPLATPSLEPVAPMEQAMCRKVVSDESTPEQQALALLRAVAILALEGKPRPAFAPPAPIKARVPLHAAALLGRLLGVENAYQRPEELQADLNGTRLKSAEVNWGQLLLYVAVETFLVYTGIMYLPMVLLLTKERDPATNDGCAGFYAFILLLNGLFWSVIICPPLIVLIAVLMRGGFSFYLTDMALVTRNGQRAARWRCALRALLTCIQLFVITAVPAVGTLLLIGKIPYPIQQSWGALALYFHLLVYALLGEALLAWLPGRSLPDRVCGTYLVPK